MATSYTSLLGLALPVTGELSGTWGDTVNNSITSLLDSAIAGTTTISSDADVTLTTTTGAANTSREAILLWTAGGTVTRNITAPAQSKTYIVINASSSTQSIVLRGVGPTTGVTIIKGESAVCAWNGSDFIKVSNISGAGVFSSITNTGLTSGRVVYTTTGGLETSSANLTFDGTTLTAAGFAGPLNGTVGATTANTGSFTSLAYTTTLTGGTGIVNLGSGQFYKDSSGNVGIGTSSPSVKFQVFGGSIGGTSNSQTVPTPDNSTNSVQVISNNYSSGSGETNFWNTAATLTGGVRLMQVTGSGTYNDMAWFQKNATLFYTGNTERMRIDSSGNVGIGTTNPSSSRVYIANASNSGSYKITQRSALTIEDDTTNTNGPTTLTIAGNQAATNPTNNARVSLWGQGRTGVSTEAARIDLITSQGATSTNINGNLTFSTSSDSTTPTERMRIDSSGSLLVGTTTSNSVKFVVDSGAANFGSAQIKGSGTLPDNNDNAVLYVNHAGTAGTGFRVRTDQALTGTNFAHVLINNVSAGINGLQVSQYGTGWIASFDKGGTVAMRIDSSGNVLVGTSSTLPVNLASGKFQVLQTSTSGHGASFKTNATSGFAAAAFSRDGNNGSVCEFGYDTSTTVGTISVTSSAASFNTSSTSGVIGVDATTVAFNTGSVERMRIDSSGNVGIGTTSISALLHVAKGSAGTLNYPSGTWASKIYYQDDAAAGGLVVGNRYASESVNVFEVGSLFGSGTAWGSFYRVTGSGTHVWGSSNSGTERMRLDGNGNLLVGTTSTNSARINSTFDSNASNGGLFLQDTRTGSAGGVAVYFKRDTSIVGNISTTNTATAYNTSSDYRLKQDIAPMTGALDRVVALKPVTYKWKSDGADAEGFIAHELAEVCPHAVTGEKDAVDEDGNPRYQGIDVSFLVATLTAAIQELKAEFDAYKATHP